MVCFKQLGLAAVVMSSLGFASAASAAPLAMAPAGTLGSDAPVQHVDWACGPGRHQDSWGRCRISRPPRYFGWGQPAYGGAPYWSRPTYYSDRGYQPYGY